MSKGQLDLPFGFAIGLRIADGGHERRGGREQRELRLRGRQPRPQQLLLPAELRFVHVVRSIAALRGVMHHLAAKLHFN